MDMHSIKLAFAEISDCISANVDLLTMLDQQSGDGDLGVSMRSGFEAASAFVAGSNERDCGRLLNGAADAFNRAAPSSLGTILSFFLKGMARRLRGIESFDHIVLATAMEQGLKNVMEKAGSKPGEKTILDALAPAVSALNMPQATASTAFTAAASAAETGAESTRRMQAVWGRAAYYGAQSIGKIDGGAVVGKLIFKSLSSAAGQQ